MHWRNDAARRGMNGGLCLLLVALLVPPALAENPLIAPSRTNYVPDELKRVSVDEHLGNKIPLDLSFNDENGKAVPLSTYFDGRRPVILQLGYYGCPMLCDLVSQGLVTSIKDLGLDASKDYQLLYLSIDPKEGPTLAARKKKSYVEAYGRAEAESGWHFLTGQFSEIEALTKSIGFNYKWVPAQQQFSHPAVLVVLTPEGKISRYMYGVKFDKKTLKYSLIEASNNKIGTTVDHFVLTCLQYDGTQGRYAFAAMRFMQIGGVLTVVVMAFVFWRLFRMERRRQAAGEEAPSGA